MTKPKLLLHACCGPCATVSIQKLMPEYQLVCYYFNPSITDFEEYKKREKAFVEVCKHFGVDYVLGEFDPDSFMDVVKGFENEKEGGLRCDICFKQRLEKSAQKAKDLSANYFSTSLSLSPYKNRAKIEEIAKNIASNYGIEFIPDGLGSDSEAYKNSINISKELNLYRQKYCGCQFSKGQ